MSKHKSASIDPKTALASVLICGLSVGCASSGRRPSPGVPDPLSRIEVLARILVLEDSRTLGAGAMASFLANEDPGIRRRASLAAGRIGDPLALPNLQLNLRDRDVEVRRASAMALGWMAHADAGIALTGALQDSDPVVRGRAGEALGRIGSAPSGALIAEAFRKALPKTPGGVLKIRGDDAQRADDPWVELRLYLSAMTRLKDAEALASAVIGSDASPFVDWWACVGAAARLADKRLTPILLAGASAEDPYIRSLAARGLGALKDSTHLSVVRRLVEDKEPAVIREALRATARIEGLEAASIAALHVDSANLTLRREALLALAALPPHSAGRARIIENVGHSDPWIRSAAWPALIRTDAEDVGLVLSTIGPDADWRVRAAVAQALAESLEERAAPLLLAMLSDTDARVVAAVLRALVLARGLDAVPTLQDHAVHHDLGVRAAAVSGLSSLQEKAGKGFSETLGRAYDASLGDDDADVRIALVEALAKSRDESSLSLLRRMGSSDPSRVVRQKALGVVGQGVAPPEPTALRLNDARRIVSLYDAGSASLYSPRVLIHTRHGAIELALDLVDAPLASLSFVRLAQSGFYNGLTFHRVIQGFVAQVGDPRGDGEGGAGFTLRCEFSGRPFGRGAVGMATNGKDTGSSQFFIATEPAPHLDGAYTQFGQVLSGMDVLEKIRPGDVILRLDAFDGRELR